NRPGGFGGKDLYMSTRQPLVADHFTLSAPVMTTAGQTVSLTLTAWDHYGNIATGYTGTVIFASSDPQATLPTDSPFSAANNGAPAFDAVLMKAGPHPIKVSDPAGVAISAKADLQGIEPVM